MKCSGRSQLSSSSWQGKVLPSGVVLFACLLIVVSKGVPDKDVDRPSRKHGPSERRLKSLNITNQGSTDNTPAVSLSRDASEVESTASSPSSSPGANASLKKHRLIHGSKNAVTITKKEYLKKDWCKTEPFQQVVEEEGCIQKRVTNRFCYGQCNSFFIPKTDKEDQDASSFRSCAYCTPKVAEWVTIVLRCPSRTPPFKRKRVQIVKQCKCMAVKLD